MKLSKLLLGAIMVGITVQTTTGCKKDDEFPKPRLKKEGEKNEKPAYDCPGCGLG